MVGDGNSMVQCGSTVDLGTQLEEDCVFGVALAEQPC